MTVPGLAETLKVRLKVLSDVAVAVGVAIKRVSEHINAAFGHYHARSNRFIHSPRSC